MTAPRPRDHHASLLGFNGLRRGHTYRAVSGGATSVGEYLGMEAPHGEWSILLRRGSSTESIALADVTSLHNEAA